MATQRIDVAYADLTGIQFFHRNGTEFSGDLVCPRAGGTFQFDKKAGSTGWDFVDLTTKHVNGPTVNFTQTDSADQIILNDPGNGTQNESNYEYTLCVTKDGVEHCRDPKIKNTGGNTTVNLVGTIARLLLGLAFLVFGANAFLQFLPAAEFPEQGTQFLGLLWESGYFNWIAVLKIVAGVLLLVGRYVPLALTLLGPILVNILLFHISFDPKGIVMGLILTAIWLVVFWSRRSDFQGLFRAD